MSPSAVDVARPDRGSWGLLVLLAAMGLVHAGRPVCLLAQRIPPVVWLVRAIVRRNHALASRRFSP